MKNQKKLIFIIIFAIIIVASTIFIFKKEGNNLKDSGNNDDGGILKLLKGNVGENNEEFEGGFVGGDVLNPTPTPVPNNTVNQATDYSAGCPDNVGNGAIPIFNTGMAIKRVNVRAKPTTKSKIIRTLSVGEKIKPMLIYDHWVRISEGYVCKKYLNLAFIGNENYLNPLKI